MVNIQHGFTLKYIQKDVTWDEDDYIMAMDNMEKVYKAKIVELRYERDHLDRLHVHGTMLSRKGLRYSLYKHKYLHVHCDPLLTKEDETNWENYINKDIYLAYQFQELPPLNYVKVPLDPPYVPGSDRDSAQILNLII